MNLFDFFKWLRDKNGIEFICLNIITIMVMFYIIKLSMGRLFY